MHIINKKLKITLSNITFAFLLLISHQSYALENIYYSPEDKYITMDGAQASFLDFFDDLRDFFAGEKLDSLYNEPEDKWEILVDVQKYAISYDTFAAQRKYTDFWSGDEWFSVTATSAVLQLQSEEGHLFFYTFLTNPAIKEMWQKDNVIPQFLEFITQVHGLEFDLESKTCKHPILGIGKWELKSNLWNDGRGPYREPLGNDYYSLALSIYFGDANGDDWFNTTNKMQKKK